MRLPIVLLLVSLCVHCATRPSPQAAAPPACDTSGPVPAMSVSNCSGGCPPQPLPIRPLSQAIEYPDPPQWSGPALNNTLTMQKSCPPAGMADLPSPQYMYNGLYIPPVLRVWPKLDTIGVRVANATQPIDVANFQFTNIHFHGMNVSPVNTAQGLGDNVFVVNNPGDPPNKYAVAVPQGHPLGTFWYHPHPHMFVEHEVLGGMSGAIVVSGLIETYYPQLVKTLYATKPDRDLLLKDYVPAGKSAIGTGCAIKSVNGIAQNAANPGLMTLPYDTVQLIHMANIGADQFFDIEIRVADGSLNGGPKQLLYVIAYDGNPTFCVDTKSNTNVACTVPMTDVFLPPGSRADVLVQLPRGTYGLWSAKVDTGSAGDPNCEQQLGWIVASQPQFGNIQLSTLRSSVSVPRLSLADLLGNRKSCTSGPAAQGNPVVIPFTEDPNGTWFSILPGGQTYRETNPADLTVTMPCVAEWTLQNLTQEAHVFHIHQMDFVVENDGLSPNTMIYRDTVNIEPGQSVTILADFMDTSIAGNFVYHCHIVNHEDLGMMANICATTQGTPCKPIPAPHSMPMP